MMRAIRQATLAGALLLGASCGNQEPPAPAPSPIVTPTVFVDPPAASTRVSGFAWDPEAFFFSWATCGALQCPISPVLSDLSPLFLRSVVNNATVTLLDPVTSSPAAQPVSTATDPRGTWTIASVPSRENPPFFALSLGTGALPTTQPPGTPPTLPPIPPGNYLPTVTARPIATRYSMCLVQEAIHVSDSGILDAVARYLTAVKGQPTTVADFVNPTKYAGVTIFWMFASGFPTVRGPAAGTTVEASSGTVLHVAWSPPRPEIPAAIHSPRWFFVMHEAPTSPLGITVVLHPAGSSPPAVTYTPTDPVTSEEQLRPWKFQSLTLPLLPTVITFAGFQFQPSNYAGPNPNAGLPPYHLCLP